MLYLGGALVAHVVGVSVVVFVEGERGGGSATL